MGVLTQFASFTIQAFILGLGAIVAYRLVTGQINTSGLLQDKLSGDLSPRMGP